MKKAIFTFLLTVLFFAAPLALAQSVSIVSGNGQVVREYFVSGAPLVVQVKDANGNPMPGAAIKWDVTKGSGTLNSQQNVTDSNGQATTLFVGSGIQPGYSFISNAITATSQVGSVEFKITTGTGQSSASLPLPELINPTLEDRKISGPAGTTLAGALVVHMVAQSGSQQGQSVPNVGIRLVSYPDATVPAPAACNAPGGTVLTDSAGRASCDLVLTGSPGTYTVAGLVGEYQNTPTITLTITSAPACTYAATVSNSSFGASASSGTLNVTAGSGCGWTATSNAGWITIPQGASGSGNGSTTFNVAANSGAARSGTIQVANRTLTIMQSGGGTGAAGLSITSAAALPTGTLNTSYSTTLTATGGQPPYTWSIPGGLPGGLSFGPSTGVMNGTPSAAGTYSIAATVTDAAGTSKSQTFTLSITSESAGPVITTTGFPAGVTGQAYQQAITTSGGCASLFSPLPSIRVSSGSLPTGLSLALNSSGGFSISGTPVSAGTANFALTATDACGRSSSSNFTLAITGTGPGPGPGPTGSITVNPTSLTFNIRQNGEAPADQSISVAGGNGAALKFSATTSSPLIRLTQTAGTTPTTLVVAMSGTGVAVGVYNATISITSPDISGTVTVPVTVNVAGATAVAVSPVTLTFRDSAPQTLTVTGGSQFTASASSDRNWLSVSPGTGNAPATITVTPNLNGLAAGSYNGAIAIVPSGGSAINIPVSLIVPPPATLTANPTAVTFTRLAGSQSPEPFRTISANSSGSQINFTVTADQPWIVVNPSSGSAPGNFGISVNAAGLAPGMYTGKVQLSPGPSVSVTLTVTPPGATVAAVTNAASFAVGPVSPGEFVTLFGTNIGPSTPAGLQLTPEGLVGTQLSDTRVLFDGIAAPLIYVSQSQVSAIVPYEVYGNTSTRVQVEYKGTPSAALELRVVDAAPAIFPGAVLNQDTTPNSPQNAADPGSIIVFYATGEGQTNPGGSTGKLTSDVLAKPLLNVGVQIDGQAAEVLYAGAAPGFAQGLIQVNARLPNGVRRGVDVPLVLTVGNASSPAGAVVSMKP